MTIRIVPGGATLGARVEGLDLSQPLSAESSSSCCRRSAATACCSFPKQDLSAAQLRDFSANFGELEVNVANAYQEPGVPEVMILSNIVENGKPIGLADAGQDWHTDMSYSSTIAFANVLYGIKIPHRDGKPLGATEFCNMHAAYDGLPDEMKQRLDGMTVLHDFNKFWEMMRRERGSTRPPLTEAQRKAQAAGVAPDLPDAPASPAARCCTPIPATRSASTSCPRRRATRCSSSCSRTRCSPNTATRIRGTRATCSCGTDIGTIHNAIPDYRPDEHRAHQALPGDGDALLPRRRHAARGGRHGARDRMTRGAAGCYSIADLRALARRRLPRAVFDFFDGGAEDERTLAGNSRAFERWHLAPRVLVDVAAHRRPAHCWARRPACRRPSRPTGAAGFGRRGADVALARAAAKMGMPYTLSSSATTAIETIADKAPGRLWFQAYVLRNRDFFLQLIERARASRATKR